MAFALVLGATLFGSLWAIADEGNALAATLVAWLMASAASRRTESRGGHYRVDFPEPDPAWRARQVVDGDGWSMLASPEVV